MRITLNAMLLSRQRSYRSGGINRVIVELLAGLARDSRGHTYEAFAPEAPPPGDPLAAPHVRYHAVGASMFRPSRRIPWEQTVLAAKLARDRPDLLHSLAYATPIAWRGPSVVTVYDLTFMRFPGAFNTGNRLYLTAITRLSARRARRVITISEHSRADIVNYLGVPAHRVDVAYPACDERYRPLPSEEVEAFRRANDLPGSFIFTLGTLEPRKNLSGLLAAYARIPEAARPPLYAAGGTGWQYSAIFEQVKQLGLERYVHFLGFVPEDALPLWYNAAHLFAYPSLYEGFGLPVLEAMACGVPVITSNAASIPEVAGPAAIQVMPSDSTQLATQMQRVLADSALRQEMREKGFEQARRFSWTAMVDETVQTYARAVSAEERK